MDLTADTVTADALRQGYTAHSADGEEITGTAASTVSGEILRLRLVWPVRRCCMSDISQINVGGTIYDVKMQGKR